MDFKVKAEVLQATLDYLQEQKYKDVNRLINKLMVSQPIKDEVEED